MDQEKGSTLKLVDFKNSTFIEKNSFLKEQIGAIHYVAPEILLGEQYDYSCDIWSVGVLIYILLVGVPPFEGNNNIEISKNIIKGKQQFDGSADKLSKYGKDILQRMLTADPSKRICANEAYAHPWVQENFSVEPLDPKIIQNILKFENQKEKLLTQQEFNEIKQSIKP